MAFGRNAPWRPWQPADTIPDLVFKNWAYAAWYGLFIRGDPGMSALIVARYPTRQLFECYSSWSRAPPSRTGQP